MLPNPQHIEKPMRPFALGFRILSKDPTEANFGPFEYFQMTEWESSPLNTFKRVEKDPCVRAPHTFRRRLISGRRE